MFKELTEYLNIKNVSNTFQPGESNWFPRPHMPFVENYYNDDIFFSLGRKIEESSHSNQMRNMSNAFVMMS
jgi:hypothetical protein